MNYWFIVDEFVDAKENKCCLIANIYLGQVLVVNRVDRRTLNRKLKGKYDKDINILRRALKNTFNKFFYDPS